MDPKNIQFVEAIFLSVFFGQVINIILKMIRVCMDA
jgi:hypothetical protein